MTSGVNQTGTGGASSAVNMTTPSAGGGAGGQQTAADPLPTTGGTANDVVEPDAMRPDATDGGAPAMGEPTTGGAPSSEAGGAGANSAGAGGACALAESGNVYCWDAGSNHGLDFTATPSLAALGRVTTVTVGQNSVCGVATRRQVQRISLATLLRTT